VDSKGLTHLSKEPPPQEGKLIEILEYSVRTDKPARTDQRKAGKEPAMHSSNGMAEKSQAAEEELKPKKIVSTGEIPSPVNIPPGCSFHLRCPGRMEVCSKNDPGIVTLDGNHEVRCHLYPDSSED